MATGITTYQCPACTAPLHFVGESGKLECDYCGKTYEVAEIERLFREKEAASAAAQTNVSIIILGPGYTPAVFLGAGFDSRGSGYR